jgi:hypothetical protein
VTTSGFFQRKAVVVQAIRWDRAEAGYDVLEWADMRAAEQGVGFAEVTYDEFVAGPSEPETGEDWGLLQVETATGKATMAPHDWLVQGSLGEFSVVTTEVFEATYERLGGDRVPS